MSARVVISCDGDWHGMPCRGALPMAAGSLGMVRYEAALEGWSTRVTPALVVEDLCPAHTAREGRS
jgi:hypothetical protein